MGNNDLKNLGEIIGKNIFWMIMPLGAAGNLLIIVYFLKINFANKLTKMSLYHFLIIQLAIVDLMTSVTTSVTIGEFYKPAWRMGSFMCKIGYPFLISILPYVSYWILVLISYERYRSITQPFAIRGTKCKYSIIIFLIIVICCLAFIPFMLNTKIEVDAHKNRKCVDGMRNFSPTDYVFYALFLRTLDCFLPAFLMYFFLRRIQNWMNKDTNQLPLTEESKKRNSLALKTLRNLIIVYICCVFPGKLVVTGLHVEDNFRTDGRRFYFNFVHELFSLVSLLNNVVNVFVYAVMIKDFRRFLLTLITFGRL